MNNVPALARNCIILAIAAVLPLDSVISPMRNNFASNIVLHTVCNVGIIVFSSSNVIGNRGSLLGNVFAYPVGAFLL